MCPRMPASARSPKARMNLIGVTSQRHCAANKLIRSPEPWRRKPVTHMRRRVELARSFQKTVAVAAFRKFLRPIPAFLSLLLPSARGGFYVHHSLYAVLDEQRTTVSRLKAARTAGPPTATKDGPAMRSNPKPGGIGAVRRASEWIGFQNVSSQHFAASTLFRRIERFMNIALHPCCVHSS